MPDNKIKLLIAEVDSFEPHNAEDVENFRVHFLGRKGVLKDLYGELKNVDPESRKSYGKSINSLKCRVEEKLTVLNASFASATVKKHTEEDLTLPGTPLGFGSRHPVSIVRNKIIGIFTDIGFTVSEGPELETDWYNFTALNMPEDHPAKDMQDTFYLGESHLLRTHTSPQQIRIMENSKPPIRIICPGRVYRNETITARAHCIFHQVEGLYVDEGVSFADLKQTLYYFAQEMFGKDIKIRFRPSYFPFTEPSAEMDISCIICKGKGCSVCKRTGWVEILGCGMVDPTVLENCNIDSGKYTGYAFGCGVERPAMLKYRINDIRLFFENDVRFLEQFSASV